jgi:hypothetical protein
MARWSLSERASVAVACAAAALAGCRAKIGDDCVTPLDCSTLGDRLCDTTQPDGYCTLFNCEPDTCPEEAVCVVFRGELDPACGPLDDARHARFTQSFCMRVCEEADDCRSGYECVRPIDRRARVLDFQTEEDDPQSTRICLAATGPPEPPPSAPPGICSPGEGAGGLTPYQPGAGGSGGS